MWSSVNVNELYPRWLTAQENGRELTLIDVRTPEEFAQAHVPGAMLMPLASLPARVAEIPENGTVFLICHSGGRSAQACDYLMRQHGRANLVNVEGGTLAWAKAGYPVAQGGC